MNRTKIEWTTYTWNPITGCLRGCWYCYAKKLFTRFHKSFEPTFYPERLEEPFHIKKPAKIFVCSVSDLFAPWTSQYWQLRVLDVIENCPWHTFQLLTKCPEGIPKDYRFPDNVWVGVTATNDEEAVKATAQLSEVQAKVRFLSLEPLLGPVRLVLWHYGSIEWLIIGKLTGSKKIKLEPEWVESLIIQARYFNLPIFIKNNVSWLEKIQEFPKENVSV